MRRRAPRASSSRADGIHPATARGSRHRARGFRRPDRSPSEDVFSAPSYDHQAGTTALLTWAAGGAHDADAVTSGPDGQPLFHTELIRSGSVPVPGTQYLSLGAYPFICTIHAGMASSLNVNTGTPLPRPAVKLRLKSKSLEQVLSSKAVKVKATISGGSGEKALVNLRLGKRRIGKARSTTKTKTLKIPLTKKGRAALEGRAKAKLKAQARIDFGSPAKATGLLK